MRIDSLGRSPGGPVASRAGAARGGFSLGEASHSGPMRQAAPLGSAPSLDALLALQAVQPESQREKRRRELARGRGLLDALDGMKLAMIDGRDDRASLSALAGNLAQRRGPTGDAELDDALSAIELRVQVELAKRGA